MGKKGILTGFLVLLIVSTVWAGDSVTIAMSCTIPSIPGVNAPPNISETLVRNQLRDDVAKINSTATVGEEFIEKEESKVTLLAQGEKVTREVKTIYTR
ncbi:MAG: hypothetical protein PHR84_04180 [Candidatus Omnitrophica bacterium]|nr:hypothetical protein [Candidatus Omnitrophota bacterium]MDD5660321.1 hypothetical protein [Candidatus Omnitrophota bacterium]